VQGLADRVEDVAWVAGREHVRLQLGRREVVPLGQVEVRAPGSDTVGEGDPDPAVYVAARVEVPIVDRQAALDSVGLDAQDLDAELTGEAPREALLEAVGVGQRRSSAAPSS
jgi:hypothetical protein